MWLAFHYGFNVRYIFAIFFLSPKKSFYFTSKVFFLLEIFKIKKETLAQVFSCEFYENFKNFLFTVHLLETASEIPQHETGTTFYWITGNEIWPVYVLKEIKNFYCAWKLVPGPFCVGRIKYNFCWKKKFLKQTD